MEHKRRNFTLFSLVSLFITFVATVIILLSFHKDQLVILDENGAYRNFIPESSELEEGQFSIKNRLAGAFNYTISGVTSVTSGLASFINATSPKGSSRGEIIVTLLVLFPFLVAFLFTLSISTNLEPERLFIYSILSEVIICFTFFSAIIMTVSDMQYESTLNMIPLEQISAFATINFVIFTVLFAFFVVGLNKITNKAE